MRDMENIGDRIKEIRGQQSRAEFAEILEIHPQTLYMYEKGKRVVDVELIQKICLKFDVSVEWLIFGEKKLQALRESSSNEELKANLKEKEKQLAKQEEYINEIKNDLITAQTQAIKSYELVLKTILHDINKEE